MKKIVFFLLLFITIGAYAQLKNSDILKTVRTVSFNNDWFFHKGDAISAKGIGYNDGGWKIVHLPHDWSIEDLPNQTPDSVQGPFSRYSIGKAATGWTVGGTAWYKKIFKSEEGWQNKLISIHFDGVYMNSEVYLNGCLLGRHPYGYTPFYYDLSRYLKPAGQENILLVRVKNEGKNSRWYSGSGIYRDVHLTVTELVHIDTWGVYVTTPMVSEQEAIVQINTTIKNEQNQSKSVTINTTIISSKGKVVSQIQRELLIPAQRLQVNLQEVTLLNPELWSIETPVMYKAVTEISSGSKILDCVETPFGVRSIQFDSQKGFLLNGKTVLLKGGCIHHDNGPLGASAFQRAEERKIEILKKNGFNAIRTSHNPPSKHLLDACDKLGMLVIDEAFDTWVRPKNPEDYNIFFNEWWPKDLHSMLLRDRNHPSIIMWSIGNEIYEAPDQLGQELAEKLANEVRSIDKTRPVTEAFVFLPPFTKKSWKEYEPHLSHIDIDGYNYFLVKNSIYFQRDSAVLGRIESEHFKHPEKLFYASESFPNNALENWRKTEEKPYFIGSFKWTSFDYLGEAGLGKSRLRSISRPIPGGILGMGLFFKDNWPLFNSSSGDFDLIGNKKAASFYQDVVWGLSPIEILVHRPIPADKQEAIAPWGFPDELKSWTWPGQEGKRMQVNVYTRCEIVKLELNGRVIAVKPLPPGSITVDFNINYQPGILIAKAFTKGKQVGSSTLVSAGKPIAIRLKTDRTTIKADRNDLSFVNVEIIDDRGNVVPSIDSLEVQYQIEGNAIFAAVANGNGEDMSSFQQPHKKVFRGRGLVILRPTGKRGTATLKANATGLKDGYLEIVME